MDLNGNLGCPIPEWECSTWGEAYGQYSGSDTRHEDWLTDI